MEKSEKIESRIIPILINEDEREKMLSSVTNLNEIPRPKR